MISNLAEKFAEKLIDQETLQREDKEIYSYGLFMLFSNLIFSSFTLIFGLILGMLGESAVFYLVFILVRGFAGGIHAEKESVCTIATTLSLFFSLSAIKVLSLTDGRTVSGFLFIAGLICIFLFSPLDNDAKKLAAEEKREYRKKSLFVSAIISVLGVVFLAFDAMSFFYSCASGIALEGILLTLGKISSGRKRRFSP